VRRAKIQRVRAGCTSAHIHTSNGIPVSAIAPDYRKLFRSSPSLYLVLTPGLEIIEASDAYLRATMTLRREVIGKPLFDVFPDDPADPSATGVANLSASLARVLRTGLTDIMPMQKYNIRRPEAQGGGFEERYWIPANSAVVSAGGSIEYILTRVEDVTETVAPREPREQREREAVRLRGILEAVPEAILEVDGAGRLVLVNEAAVRMFGYSREELLTLSVDALVSGPDRVSHRQRRAEYLANPRSRPMGQGFEVNARRRDGSLFPVEISLSPTSLEKDFRVLASVRDISDRKRSEEQLALHRAQLISSARLSALGMMAGGIAHEIGNPMAVIHAYASDLLSAIEEDGAVALELVKKASERIRQMSERIAKIVRSMRALAREGSQDPVHPARVHRIVEDALEICRETFRVSSVQLFLPVIDPGLSVLCRESQVAQVLLNLLQNAYDAVRERDGERWVRLDVAAGATNITFSVCDSGPGIPAHLEELIMRPFFTTKEVGKGTGLGLSISRKVLDEHGSELTFTESAGHTCFCFSLPKS
jgi:PAS domain S-box-containing protein